MTHMGVSTGRSDRFQKAERDGDSLANGLIKAVNPSRKITR